MDDLTRRMVFGVAAPIALGAAAAITSRFPARTPDAPSQAQASRAWKGALAAVIIGAAWVIGQYGFFGAWQIPAISSDALLRFQAPVAFIVAFLGLAVVVFWIRGASAWHTAKIGAAVGLASASVVLWRKMSGTDAWPTGRTALALVSAAAWGALLAWPIARMVDDGDRVSGAAVLAGIGAAIAAGALGTGSQSVAELSAPLVIACVGALGVIAVMRGAMLTMTTIAGVCGGLAGPLLVAAEFSSLPQWLAWLLATAPLFGYIAGKLLGDRGGPVLGAAVRIGVPALIAAAGIAPGLIALAKFAMGERDASGY